MKKPSIFSVAFALSIIFCLTSCDLVGGVFKAGAWFGVIGVVLVVVLVLWLLGKLRG